MPEIIHTQALNDARGDRCLVFKTHAPQKTRQFYLQMVCVFTFLVFAIVAGLDYARCLGSFLV